MKTPPSFRKNLFLSCAVLMSLFYTPSLIGNIFDKPSLPIGKAILVLERELAEKGLNDTHYISAVILDRSVEGRFQGYEAHIEPPLVPEGVSTQSTEILLFLVDVEGNVTTRIIGKQFYGR